MSCFGARYVISHDMIHIGIFHSLTTTPKSVHGKHPFIFRIFKKHLIVELRMYENGRIGMWSFSGISSCIQHLVHMPFCSSWSFYPKTVEITCLKRNANKFIYRSLTTLAKLISMMKDSAIYHFNLSLALRPV